jgi:thiol-disulfide isomerase/thioredoxin
MGVVLFTAVSNATDSGRAEVQPVSAIDLLARIKRTVREPETAARNARIAQLADQLDRLPDTELDAKIEGHLALETVDAIADRHATWLIASAKTWDAARRKKYAPRVVDSYIELAGILASDGRNDEALALLRRAPADLPEVGTTAEHVSGLLGRLELIGTPAAPLTAPRWLGVPAGTTVVDLKGKVTLIEFSAHWCAPCTQSYPALNRFRKAFGAQGFHTIIVTELYGYFGTARNLAPDAELARDRAYFAKLLPGVPIAIGNQVTITSDGEKTVYSPARDPNNLQYRVGGLPQFYLVDRQGRIRFLLSGYGNETEAKLLKFIRRLLSES